MTDSKCQLTHEVDTMKMITHSGPTKQRIDARKATLADRSMNRISSEAFGVLDRVLHLSIIPSRNASIHVQLQGDRPQLVQTLPG
jgi:hypothetical protein